MFLYGIVLLKQGRIHGTDERLGLCALFIQFGLFALGFLFIFGFQLIKSFFGVGGFHANNFLLFFMRGGFLNNASDLRFILADGVPAVTDFSHQGFYVFGSLGRIGLKTIFQGPELVFGMGDRLLNDIFAICHRGDLNFNLLVLFLAVQNQVTRFLKLLAGR